MAVIDNEPPHAAPPAAGNAAASSARRRRIPPPPRSVLRSIPTAGVLVALGGVGYWGHVNDWRAPRLTSLLGSSAPCETEDWCTEHGVPDSRCIKCRPELAGEAAKDWCREHGVAESRCTICHPEILTTGVAGDWCREHGVPESSCTLCHPEIAVRGAGPSADTDIKVLDPHAATATDTDHPATTRPARDPATCQTHGLRVQFASADSVKKAGVRIGSVIERPMTQTISANAETQYDRTRLAQVASRAAGFVWRVDCRIGQAVRKGDVLALVDASEAGRAKAELLTSSARRELRTRTVRRIRELLPQKISTESELQEAEAALREAEINVFNARQSLINLGLTAPDEAAGVPDEQELKLLGLPEPVRASLDDASSANLVPLVAPLDGVVIQQAVVAGEVIEASRPLFTIADTRRMWLMIDVPQSQIGRVALGRTVRFRMERGDDTAPGTITWISTAVDDQTRTVKVRAELDNADGRTLANTFGEAQIAVRSSPNAIAVPSEAIQWEGCCHIVFVRLSEEIFEARKVRLGTKDAHYAEVLVGLLPGEAVATAGSHVLKSEILKSNLGAGCCDAGN